MRMLDDLKAVLDDIEASDEWAYNFVTDIIEPARELLNTE